MGFIRLNLAFIIHSIRSTRTLPIFSIVDPLKSLKCPWVHIGLLCFPTQIYPQFVSAKFGPERFAIILKIVNFLSPTPPPPQCSVGSLLANLVQPVSISRLLFVILIVPMDHRGSLNGDNCGQVICDCQRHVETATT